MQRELRIIKYRNKTTVKNTVKNTIKSKSKNEYKTFP